ncbi:MAG: CocE/NonD family hydrolase [Halolamina sp.]
MARDPEYGVTVTHDVPVTTRDGVELATDIYRPADPESGEAIEAPQPALLYRTPYDKRTRGHIEEQGRYYAARGYVVAVQDVRGRFASEGEFYLLKNEAEDGADTVEWLADRPYCDGQVGTMGTSYMAWTQSALATQEPDGLAAMFVNQGAANAWDATLRQNGAFELRWLTWAYTLGAPVDPEFTADVVTGETGDPAVQRQLVNTRTDDLLADWPVLPGQSPLRHAPKHEEWAFDFLTTPGESEFWDDPSINFAAHYEELADVPTVYSGSWYDSYTKATCDNFEALADATESDQFLIMGPWTHGGQATWTRTFSGETEFGDAAAVDYLATRLDFFDHYLKDRNSWADQPAISYFRMGVDDDGGNSQLTSITGEGASAGAGADDAGTPDASATAGGETAAGPATVAEPRGNAEGRLRHGGTWAAAESWPQPDTEFTSFYAHGDGTLSQEQPTAPASATTYEFDPRDPVPTVGGNCSSYYSFEAADESLEELPVSSRRKESVTGRGGYDQRSREWSVGVDDPQPLDERDDVVVFRTPPLEEPVEIVGPIRVSVYGETDGPDTDFTAKLVDEYPASAEYPEGFALNLCDSICRGRYRGWRREADPLVPGDVYEFEMAPYPTANRFGVGHRIRLDISSSNFPRYDVNTNTGAPSGTTRELRVATNTVHHSSDYPTHVELPLQPL